MERSEAEKLVDELHNLECVNEEAEGSYQSKLEKLKENMISALCAEPAAPMSFEEFCEAVEQAGFQLWAKNGPEKRRDCLRTIYDHMNHSADASNMVKDGKRKLEIGYEFWCAVSGVLALTTASSSESTSKWFAENVHIQNYRIAKFRAVEVKP